jgi:hypothetical protein
MNTPTYADLQHLIAKQDVEKRSVVVTFACPQSGFSVESRAGIQRGKGAKNMALGAAKRGMWYSLRNSLLRALSSALGGGVMGRVGREVGRGVLNQAGEGHQFTEDERQAAVVLAFTRVQSKFRHDGTRWIGAHGQVADESSQLDFHAQLRGAPVSERYDQGVLARILVEISAGDGQLSDEERGVLSHYIDPSLGTIAELAARPALSDIELGEVSQGGVRDTLLLLGWATALSDRHLAASEQSRLSAIASGLGIKDARAKELQASAQAFLFEQALGPVYASGARDEASYAEALEVAAALGLSPEDAERADVRYRKARGLF